MYAQSVMEISCEFHYDSAHFLPNVPIGHQCGRTHGHTYRLIVALEGPVGPDGFVIDFAEVKQSVKPMVDKLDHYLLNDIIPNPTVENQLLWFWGELIKSLPLSSLAIYEGLSNSATYRG